jgi:DNA-binding winged helix-turn-helix (wHTH) protein
MRVLFGTFMLDRDAKTLSAEGRSVHLTPKAFLLLERLVDERPRVVSKSDVSKWLWPDTFVGEGSIANLITEIRTALGDDPRAPRYVRTVHRFGYAFCAPVHDGLPALPLPEVAAMRLVMKEKEVTLREGENRIGRAQDCQIWIDSSTVSRYHARIVVAGDVATIEDLQSKNGTFVSGGRLEGPRRLVEGDLIELGEIAMRFRVLRNDSTTKTLTLPHRPPPETGRIPRS